MKNKRNAFLRRALLATLCSGVIAAVTVNASDMIATHASASDKIALSGIQMRGAVNGWYYYLVFLSNAYTDATSTEGISGYQDYLSSDKIRLYLGKTDYTTAYEVITADIYELKKLFENSK